MCLLLCPSLLFTTPWEVSVHLLHRWLNLRDHWPYKWQSQDSNPPLSHSSTSVHDSGHGIMPILPWTSLKSLFLRSRVHYVHVTCCSRDFMHKLAAPFWPEFNSQQQFAWCPYIWESRRLTLRCPGPEARPYTPSPSGWSSLEISFSKVWSSELKAPQKPSPRIQESFCKSEVSSKLCQKCWLFWCSGQFSRATQFKTNVYLIRTWLLKHRVPVSETRAAVVCKALQSRGLSR